MRSRTLRSSLTAVATAAVLVLAACGGSSSSSSGDAATDASTSGGTSSKPLTVAYSAWPGWFPIRVAEEKGFFAKEGLDVTPKYFTDYTASIDALNSGQVDANTQTLNDTMAGAATGADLKIVVNTDFSAGNDAVIVDKSIGSVKDLKGKQIAAEAGVVDHFLLLQGLEANGMSEKDIDFRGLPTDAAAAAFAAGQFDGVAVFAPFTLEALKRPGSKVLFSSKDYPGSIPDHVVFRSSVVDERPEDMRRFVKAWYATLDWIKANPDEADAIMAKQAGITPEEYASLNEGTQILTAEEALDAFADSGAPTSLPNTAKKINPFLVDSGLIQQEADTSNLFAPEFTQAYVDGGGS